MNPTRILTIIAALLLTSCGALDNVIGPAVVNRDPATGHFITPNCRTDSLPMTMSATLYLCPNGHRAHAIGGVPFITNPMAARAGAEYPLPVVNNRDATGHFITPKWKGKAPLWQATVWQAPDGHAYQSPWISIR